MAGIAKESDMLAALTARLHGAVVIAGVGNTLRGDDGAGPRFVEMLRQRLGAAGEPVLSVHLVNCHEAPENYIGPIAQLRPDTVIVVDTAPLGLAPGETRIIEADDLLEDSPSTHRVSPALFISRLMEQTAADVFVVAVQPATTSFGERLSAPVERALTQLADLIESVIRQS